MNMKTLPKILCSSVIRTSQIGDSHGGIFYIDCETKESKLLLDWNTPDINWEGRGGDRGIRGMTFYNDLLYAMAGNALFVFNKKMQLINLFTNKYLFGSHELTLHEDKLYIISNSFDSILIFDLRKEKWLLSWNVKEQCAFDPNISNSLFNFRDSIHLDSITIQNNKMYYCGSQIDKLMCLDLATEKFSIIENNLKHTHNAQLYKEGIIYNLAFQSKTVYRKDNEIIQEWITPRYKKEDMTHLDIQEDTAVQGYTRGMLLKDDYVIVGNSPATINIFVLGDSKPIRSIQLTNDIRNSICGITECKWSF